MPALMAWCHHGRRKARTSPRENRRAEASAFSPPCLSTPRGSTARGSTPRCLTPPMLVRVSRDVALRGTTAAVVASTAARVAGAGFALVSGLRMGLATFALLIAGERDGCSTQQKQCKNAGHESSHAYQCLPGPKNRTLFLQVDTFPGAVASTSRSRGPRAR